jgi:hypothetical protein
VSQAATSAACSRRYPPISPRKDAQVGQDGVDGSAGKDCDHECAQGAASGTPLAPSHERSTSDEFKERRHEHEAWRVADRLLYEQLQQQDFKGPVTKAFLEQVAKYGVSIIASWALSGQILAQCHRHHVRAPHGLGRRFTHDEAYEIAGEAAAYAIKSYIKNLRGGWVASKGSLRTFFVAHCLYELPNVYRRWEREEIQLSRGLQLNPLEERSDGTEGAPRQYLLVGSAEDPADVVEYYFAIIDALTRAVRDDRTRAFLIMKAIGYTNQEIAHWFKETRKAVEGVFSRHKMRLHPRATPDEHGDAEGNKEGEYEDG